MKKLVGIGIIVGIVWIVKRISKPDNFARNCYNTTTVNFADIDADVSDNDASVYEIG